MGERRRKKIKLHQKNQYEAAGNKQGISGGHYYCDYSPRYQESYDIYEKAKEHVRKMKKRDGRKPDE